jgi:hypothetical protein
MKIYTKTGDKGKTSLFSGGRVLKSDLRIKTYGTVDELNSFIGLLCACEINHAYKEILIKIFELIQSFTWRRFILGLGTNALNKIFMRLYEDVDETNYYLMLRSKFGISGIRC